MTKEELKDARKICEKVTPGPWEEVGEGIYAGNDPQSLVVAWPHDEESYDSQFIAASRTLLPQALDALEEAHQGMATVVDALKLYRDKYDDVPELASDLSRIISAFGESTT